MTITQDGLPELSQTISLQQFPAATFEIPPYQRGYAWTSEQAEQMLADVASDLRLNIQDIVRHGHSVRACRIGAILVFEERSAGGIVRKVVDGQQRITTLMLMATALKRNLARLGQSYTDLDQILMVERDHGLKVEKHPRLSLRDDDERDFLRWLMLHGVDPESDIEDSARKIFDTHQKRRGLRKRFDHQTEERPLASMTAVFETLEEGLEALAKEIQSEFEDELGEISDILSFIGRFLKTKILIIQVSAPSELDAIRDFEKMNNRGKGLSSLDILRAKVLGMGWEGSCREDIEAAFQRISDLLPKSERLRTAFVRAVVIAGASWSCCRLITEQEALAFIDKEEISGSRPIGTDPLGYAATIEDCARHYDLCIRGLGVDGSPLDPLMCLEDLNIHRIMMPILMAGRHMPAPLYAEMARVIENVGFVFLMSGRQQKGLETWLCDQVAHVRAIRTPDDLQAFVDTRVAAFMQDHEQSFRATLSQFRLGSASGKRRIRYFLARISHHIDPSDIDLKDLSIRNSKKGGYQIEHIFPESQKALLGVDEDWRADWFGNLTLLEEYENNLARDKPFQQKRPHFARSNVAVTEALSKVWQGDCRYARAQKDFQIPIAPQDWDLDQMHDRAAFYTRIAYDLWGLKGWKVEP